ncbi:MAG: hypothetical protein HKN23_21710 [Verrucomicrobiales bacterium]|nr:hypothetical protein [Verrucomicrobiales bacterium]
MKTETTSHNPISTGGWTFVEMLVAVSMSAIFMGAAALVLASVTHNTKRHTTLVDVNIGSVTNKNFYNSSSEDVRTYSAPNYGRLVQAQEMREKFQEDLTLATACFALPRSNLNSIRPEFLDFPTGVTGANPDHPQIDSPEAFRQFLALVEPTSAGIFDEAIRNIPSTAKPNVTVFMLGAITANDFIRVNSVYEIDFIESGGKPGTYASVRRYKNGTLTLYYDVYYPDGKGDDFFPAMVAFESQGRLLKAETTALDRFKAAPGAPFYLLFFPDPSINSKKQPAWTPSDPASSPREAYEHMAGKTSFLVTAPMFPSL